jgi:C1A family cysteine protease
MPMKKHEGVPIREVKWYGYRRDVKDARDHMYEGRGTALPASVDLRPHCPPVMDQGQLGSCTAHGITGALRYLILKAGQRDFDMSRLQLYYDERVIEGSVKEDAGAEIRDGIKSAAKIGLAHEKLWPYNIKKFASKPTARVYTDAAKFRALTYKRVNVDIMQMKSVLASGFPIVIGFSVFESFESDAATRTGVIPMPDLNREQLLGGHCTYVVGYGQKEGYFTVRNSWNTDWGDKGDCYMPEGYIGSSSFGSDYWVIQSDGVKT